MLRNLFVMTLVIGLFGACMPMSRKVCIPTQGIKQTKNGAEPVRLFTALLQLAQSAKVEKRYQALIKKIEWCFKGYKTFAQTSKRRTQVYKKHECERFSKSDSKEYEAIRWLRRTLDYVKNYHKVCFEKGDGKWRPKGWWVIGEEDKNMEFYKQANLTRVGYSTRVVHLSVLRKHPFWSKLLNSM